MFPFPTPQNGKFWPKTTILPTKKLAKMVNKWKNKPFTQKKHIPKMVIFGKILSHFLTPYEPFWGFFRGGNPPNMCLVVTHIDIKA